MKNLARLILALFATQLALTGIARAVTTSAVLDQKSHVSAMPDDTGDGDQGGF